jgi:hypothetical protein
VGGGGGGVLSYELEMRHYRPKFWAFIDFNKKLAITIYRKI